MRVALIGDVGGHAVPFEQALVDLGATPGTLALPPDLHVVQVGDLVHRGPESARVLTLVAGLMGRSARAEAAGDSSVGRYTQLAGNHEAFHFDQPLFFWPEELSTSDHDLLKAWWAARSLRVCVGVRTQDRDFLVSHAGLTHGLWRRLGSPASLVPAVAALEALRDTQPLRLFRAGSMLGALEPDLAAGPFWATASSELTASWERDPMPFSQVHGHSTSYWWSSGRWLVPARNRGRVDAHKRHVEVLSGTEVIIGVDPCHGVLPETWAPLVLEGEVLL